MANALTPAQFAAKMGKVAVAVKTQDKKAIAARAAVTQQVIAATAATSSGLGRSFATRGKWVRTKPLSGDAALVNLRGGFAHLAERGSWRYPNGWDMIATNKQALRTPGVGSGFAASVKHPPLAAHPFWHRGVAASRVPGSLAYRKSLEETIHKAVR